MTQRRRSKRFIDALHTVDTRRLTLESTGRLAGECVFRAQLLLDARGVPHWIAPVLHGARICLQASPSDTSKLGRFTASWNRHEVGVVYDPTYLIKHGASAFADTTNGLIGVGHRSILDGAPDPRGTPHESVHIDTALRRFAGKPSPYQGRLYINGEKKRPHPGGAGHYAASLALDELRTYSRDLRQRVRELGRVNLASKSDILKSRHGMVGDAKALLRNSLQALATLKQTRSALLYGSAHPGEPRRFDIDLQRVRDEMLVIVTVHTPRDPDGYTVELPIQGAQPVDVPDCERIIREALEWRIETARGHLAMARYRPPGKRLCSSAPRTSRRCAPP